MKKIEFIMIIDDDFTNNIICENLIKKMDITQNVVSFQQITEAMEFLEKNYLKNNIPDIIFLDLRFPDAEHDAWYFLDRFPAILAKNTQKQPVLYVLTSSLSKKDMGNISKYPFVKGFISKPLSTEKLSKIFDI